MTYHQITFAERYTLGLLRQGRLAPAAIARVLGRHRSSILRELRRNSAHSDGTYRPQLADGYARGRRARSRRNTQFTRADWARVAALVREDWSPEQIAGWLHRHRILEISHETIYRYLWADKQVGGLLYHHLRGARKHCRKRYGAYDSRGRLAGKRPITARPAAATARTQVGHWEGDTMLGAGQAGPCVLTLVERKTGYLALGKLQRRALLLRDAAPRLGTRDQREHQRPALPVPAQAREHGPAHPTRLQSHRRPAERASPKAPRLSNPGGVLCPLTLSVALQT